jgi:hypothetical protein
MSDLGELPLINVVLYKVSQCARSTLQVRTMPQLPTRLSPRPLIKYLRSKNPPSAKLSLENEVLLTAPQLKPPGFVTHPGLESRPPVFLKYEFDP